MKELFESEWFMLLVTLSAYRTGVALYKKTKFALFNPLLVSICVVILFLLLSGIPYEVYRKGNQVIDSILGLTVVSLGYVLYRQREYIKKNAVPIFTASVVGALVGVVSVILISSGLGADPSVVVSLEAKSVTTPIALLVSEKSGGILAITSVAVILTGIFGHLVGRWIMDKAGIRNPVARGLAMGASAHAIGTARAMDMGPVEGAISGLAIGLVGVITALLVPLVEKILL